MLAQVCVARANASPRTSAALRLRPDTSLVVGQRVASQENVELCLTRIKVSGRMNRLDRNGERAPDEVERLAVALRLARGAHC